MVKVSHSEAYAFADYLKSPLDEYVSQLGISISVERMNTRSGLVRARLRGARYLLYYKFVTDLYCISK
jgi:hypothetical protein